MRRTVPFLLALLLPTSARAACDANPLLSTFRIVTTCAYDAPCAEDQPLQLTVKPDTGCYPRWAPCAPFPFQACDRVEWDFGDGTKATGHGTAVITHTWKNPGKYEVQGTVSNTRGSKGFGGTIIIARRPIVRVHWSESLYSASETDSDVTLTVEREGDTSRAVTVLFSAGTGAASGEAWDRNIEHVVDREVTIPAGVTAVPVTLKGDETIVITAQKPYGLAVAFTQPQITVTIEEDDLYRLTSEETESNVGTPFAMRVATIRPQPTPITVTLQSSDASILAVPPSVTIPANATDATFEAQSLRAGDATITATFPDNQIVSVELLVIQHTALEFARATTRLGVDGESQVTLVAKPAAPMVVSLRAAPAGVIDLPPLVELDASGTATFPIRGLQPGVATIIATLPAQYGSTSGRLPVTVEQILTPRIATITPSFGAIGTNVIIGGTGFSPGCAVSFGDALAVSAWKDEETLTATAPPHAAGVVDVTVRCGDVTTTLPNAFTYRATKRRAVR